MSDKLLQAEQALKECAEKLRDIGIEFFMLGADEKQTRIFLAFHNNDMKHLMMTVAMELAIFGMPVPLLMTAIAHGAELLERQRRGEIAPHQPLDKEEIWEDEIYESEHEN